MRLLKESPFHVRKEAAFALANICADGGGGTGEGRTGAGRTGVACRGSA